MLGYLTTTECREEYLRKRLDDETAKPCGRCDNCTGEHRSAEIAAEAVAGARERLARPGIEVEARKQWPTGLSDLSGRIRPELGAEPGRALGRLTDIGWGNRLRELFSGADGPMPDDMFKAVVQVLASWEWRERPVAVVNVPSLSRPRLVRGFAERLAQVGRLTYLGELGYRAGTPGQQFNSAKRVQAVRATLAMPTDLAAAIAAAGGPVLLIDDQVNTGWTMTLATALVRHAGAPAVLPLVLATAN